MRSPKTSLSKKKAAAFRASQSSSAFSLSDQKCKNLFKLTSDMILIFKPEGSILEVNPSWRTHLKYEDRDLSTLSVFNILLPKDKKESEEIFRAVLRDGTPRKFQGTLVSKNGREVAVEGTVGRLEMPNRPTALSAIFHDITRFNHYEQLKDEFISTISHELRTPLTVIREGVAQVRDGLLGPVPDNQKNLLDMVLQNSDRLCRIIEELLDVSKLEAGKVRLHRKLCDIVEIAGEVIANFKTIVKRKKLEILSDFAPGKIEIYVDRDKIVQVLTNLINNALKFTDTGHIKVDLRMRDGFVECKVSDTGRGISGEDLSKAFHKFSQFAKEIGPGDRGTGLGLSICKKLIELHHGRVKIESVPLKGTTVTFALPQYSHRDLFKDAISQAMSRCMDEKNLLSIIIFDILNFESLEKKLGVKQVERIVLKMEKVMNDALRRVADVAIKDTKAIMVLLPDTKKENAYLVMGRLSQALEDFLIREQMSPKIEVLGHVVCFPEEAKTLEEVLDEIYA